MKAMARAEISDENAFQEGFDEDQMPKQLEYPSSEDGTMPGYNTAVGSGGLLLSSAAVFRKGLSFIWRNLSSSRRNMVSAAADNDNYLGLDDELGVDLDDLQNAARALAESTRNGFCVANVSSVTLPPVGVEQSAA